MAENVEERRRQVSVGSLSTSDVVQSPRATWSDTRCSSSYDMCHGLVDTGTSYVAIPDETFDMFVAQIVSGHADADCSTSHAHMGGALVCLNCSLSPEKRFPDVNFWVANDAGDRAFNFTLRHDDYVRYLDHVKGREDVQKACLLEIISSGSRTPPNHPPTYILGDTFLRRYYSVFDYAKQSVGLARPHSGDGTSFTRPPRPLAPLADIPEWARVLLIAVSSCVIGMTCFCICHHRAHDHSGPFKDNTSLVYQDHESPQTSAQPFHTSVTMHPPQQKPQAPKPRSLGPHSQSSVNAYAEPLLKT